MYFSNHVTGEQIFVTDPDYNIIIPEMSTEAECKYSLGSSVTITLDENATKEMWQTVEENHKDMIVAFDGYIPVSVQARCHKKNRINKKWLKRYGMKICYVKQHFSMDECRTETFPDHIEISSGKFVIA